jgi:tetratricopeptide (TPR) repeat protein
VALDVRHWLADEPVQAYAEPWPARLGRWGRRHRTIVAATGTLVLTALVVLSLSGVLIRQSEQKAQAARILAEEQRDRADANLHLARQAVDKTVTKIAANSRLKEADFHQLCHDLLAYLVPFYETFVKQRTKDPELEAERGWAWGLLARLRAEMGDKEAARSEYEQMQALFAQLVVDFPAVPGYRQDLAISHNNLGGLLHELGKPAEAETAYRDGLKIQAQLAQDYLRTDNAS